MAWLHSAIQHCVGGKWGACSYSYNENELEFTASWTTSAELQHHMILLCTKPAKKTKNTFLAMKITFAFTFHKYKGSWPVPKIIQDIIKTTKYLLPPSLIVREPYSLHCLQYNSGQTNHAFETTSFTGLRNKLKDVFRAFCNDLLLTKAHLHAWCIN